MSAKSKTQTHIRTDLPIRLLEPDPDNPNKMSGREFDLLVDNMQQVGITDPVLVRVSDPLVFEQLWKQLRKDKDALIKALDENEITFPIIGGHHRSDAAQYLGFTEVPVTIIVDPEFDKAAADAQMIRHNAIHGRLDPEKFVKLYNRYVESVGEQNMAELFGFADEAILDKLISQTAANLPPDMKEKFKEAAVEVKSIDDLASLLNRLFTTYGDTLTHGMMFLDYGGKDSVWLRMSPKTYKAMKLWCDRLREENRTVDEVMGRLVQLIATGDAQVLAKKLIDDTPSVEIPENFTGIPTMDTLETLKTFKE